MRLLTNQSEELAMSSITVEKTQVTIAKRVKLTYGVGFNSKTKHRAWLNGRYTPAYCTWRNILARCYCPNKQLIQPSYVGCSISEKWYDFQDFAEWFNNHKHNHKGYHLDKDILFTGNKVYSPETCCFIPQELNKILGDRKAARGSFPQGVCLHKPTKKYTASTRMYGMTKHLGVFDTPEEAYRAYKAAKEDYVKKMALEWRDRIADNVFQALMAWELPNLDNNN